MTLNFFDKNKINNGIGIKAICAISIPILKKNNDKSILLLAIPISSKAPAKPSPWSKPKPNAIIHGVLIESLFRFISVAKYTIVNAIKASIVPWGKDISSKTVKPSVILWAIVKAVIVLIIFINPDIQKSNPNINKIWSKPSNRWEKPSCK